MINEVDTLNQRDTIEASKISLYIWETFTEKARERKYKTVQLTAKSKSNGDAKMCIAIAIIWNQKVVFGVKIEFIVQWVDSK